MDPGLSPWKMSKESLMGSLAILPIFQVNKSLDCKLKLADMNHHVHWMEVKMAWMIFFAYAEDLLLLYDLVGFLLLRYVVQSFTSPVKHEKG